MSCSFFFKMTEELFITQQQQDISLSESYYRSNIRKGMKQRIFPYGNLDLTMQFPLSLDVYISAIGLHTPMTQSAQGIEK